MIKLIASCLVRLTGKKSDLYSNPRHRFSPSERTGYSRFSVDQKSCML